MIVANRKSLDEILQMIRPDKKILLFGCNESVTVCAVGGEREVGGLASELRLFRAKDGEEIEVRKHTLERQCDPEYIDRVRPFGGDYEAILSMACGAGIQYGAEKYRTKQVLLAVNTTFLGVTLEQGVWAEWCQGCGTCILDQTGGICLIARWAKNLLNGPCDGPTNWKCEVYRKTDCAWQLIIDWLKELGQSDRYEEIIPIKDWTTARDGGPRKRVGENLRL